MSVRVRCTLKLGGLVKFCFDTFGNTLPLANYEQHLFNIFINPRFFVAGQRGSEGRLTVTKKQRTN